MRVGIVTDSTAYLPAHLLPGGEVLTVPLSVLVDTDTYVEGVDRPDGELGRAIARAGGATTSRPSPSAFLSAYERLAAEGAREIVSVHLSAALSGTYDAAVLAAGVAPVAVHVVDSAAMGMALGYAVLDAARCAREGGDGRAVAEAARATAGSSTVLFCVASLEFLRRGGRIGAASALLGSALAVKPILQLREGRIVPVEKQRTMGRAVSRLADLAAAAAGEVGSRGRRSRVTVHHVGAPERAAQAAELVGRLGGEALVGEPLIVEMGLVAATHLGPGSVGMIVSPA